MRTVTGRARLISRIEVEARAFANADYTTRDLSYGRASWGCSTQARSSATGRELQRPELATGATSGHPEDGPPDAQATLTPAATRSSEWPSHAKPDARPRCADMVFHCFAPCGAYKCRTSLGEGESWLLQRGTRASWGECWPGRCHAQAQPILPAVFVGSRDAARGSLSTTRRTHARSTRNGGLSTNAPVGDARRRTHRGVRWRSGTCSGSGSAASKEASAPASPDAESRPQH
jgi:hypothetical protein